MAVKSLALWLLIVGTLAPQLCCQHWSYGLSPGGKREVDGLSETLGNVDVAFPHMDSPCGVSGCAEEPPFGRVYRMKGFLVSLFSVSLITDTSLSQT
ncbi:progonadoliberin-1-like [Solea solea]|uniref:progonadoliberin-1-like n=1 Tax=Solea solea TaxID=90069 RepID=UPI00272983C3|nr:progonadoliberin-1-like [Solea solea]